MPLKTTDMLGLFRKEEQKNKARASLESSDFCYHIFGIHRADE